MDNFHKIFVMCIWTKSVQSGYEIGIFCLFNSVHYQYVYVNSQVSCKDGVTDLL